MRATWSTLRKPQPCSTSGPCGSVGEISWPSGRMQCSASATSNDDEDAIERALEDLIERVESVDNAGDLHAIGGMEALVGTLTRERATIRAAACEACGVARRPA